MLPAMLAQSQEERKKCLEVFPTEIWQFILDKINDTDTLSTLAGASHWMAEILRPKRTLYLFAPVLRILDQQKYLNFSENQRKRKTHVNLLHCRLVSSSWKNAVDDLLQLRPYHLFQLSPAHFRSSNLFYFDQGSETMLDPVNQALFSLYKFDISYIQTTLLPEIYSPYFQTNSPSPSRYLVIEDNDIPSRYRTAVTFQWFRQVTEIFLGKVGHHFWHARIATSMETGISVEWYTQIRKYIQLLPNLRSLHIHGPFPESNMNPAAMFNILDTLIQQLPFSHLPQLSLLSAHEIPKSVINAMISANPQLKRVSFSAQNSTMSVDRRRCKLNRLVSPEMVSTSISLKKELYQQLSDRWKLSFIRLSFPGWGFFEWSQVFRKLESYRDTLRDVYLYIQPRTQPEREEMKIWKESKISLDLPNVKHFYMEIYELCSLDFLLGLKSLESLDIRLYHDEDDLCWFGLSTDVINYHGEWGNDFSTCNIWWLIPSLQKASVATCNEPVKKYIRNKWCTCLN